MHRSRRPRPFRLQRLARGPGMRVFAHAMALLLAFANLGAWAAPVAGSASSPAAQAAAGMDHHHCDGMAAKAEKPAKQQGPHGKGCPCCVGSACACLSSCMGALATVLADLDHVVPSTQPLPPADASFVDAGSERRLRPPIA